MKIFSVATVALGVGLAFAASTAARADTFDVSCSSGCTVGTGFGQLTITGGGSHLEYDFVASPGSFLQTGIETIFMSVGGTISSFNFAGGSGGPITAANGNHQTVGSFTLTYDTSFNTDGLGGNAASGSYNVGFSCSGSGNLCGNTLDVTLNGTNLSAQAVLENLAGGGTIAVDGGGHLSCTGLTGCPFSGGTGALGATASPVPAPLAGVGLPGVVAACVGLWGFARRRRSTIA